MTYNVFGGTGSINQSHVTRLFGIR